ncbi:NAD(P)H-quinone oxidoreductase chain 4 [Medicago truncatula]|uniref:NAD(P)H-quinone oxidoreductase chain 4 n=1 Tax=Medicago truncatula TaxID=3880 RepID=G7LJI4_MEDTR|nr:NAD(P)H-quinone oxidoreductase chain 4 [Medicago truncatula]
MELLGVPFFFFFAGTSYDKLRLLYLDEMGGMTIPMPKNVHDFHHLIDDFSCIVEHEWLCCRIDSFFFGIITSQKYLFMMKILS